MKKTLLILYAMIFGGVSASGHPVSVLKGQARVKSKELTIDLRIFPEDFTFFQGVKSDQEGYFSKKDMLDAREKHREFLKKHLYFLDQTGKRLPAEIAGEGNLKFDPKGLHVSQLMAQEITYKITVPLKGKPKALTIFQKLGGGTRIPALLDLSIPGAEGDTGGFRLNNGGNPRSLVLDWHHDEATIKIPPVKGLAMNVKSTTKGGLIQFKIPVLMLQSLIPLSLSDENSFLVRHLEEQKKLVTEALLGGLKLHADGQALSLYPQTTPELRDLSGKKINKMTTGPMNIHTYEVWLQASYTLPDKVKALTAQWSLFNDYISEVELGFSGFNAKSSRGFFTPYRNSVNWPILPPSGV